MAAGQVLRQLRTAKAAPPLPSPLQHCPLLASLQIRVSIIWTSVPPQPGGSHFRVGEEHEAQRGAVARLRSHSR